MHMMNVFQCRALPFEHADCMMSKDFIVDVVPHCVPSLIRNT